MRQSRPRPALTLAVGCQLAFSIASLVVARTAHADAPDECADAYERAQSERLKEHPLTARDAARICIKACPGTLAADCSQWESEIDRVISSVRLVVVDSRGVSVSDAQLSVDDAPVPGNTEIELEPGKHSARAERPQPAYPGVPEPFPQAGKQSAALEFQTKRGQRGLELKLTMDIPRPERAVVEAPSAHKTSARATWVNYSLLAGGIAGLGAGATLSLVGHLEVSHLERTCSPYCDQASVDRVRTLWWLGGGAALLGAASLTAAWLTWPLEDGTAVHAGLGSVVLSTHF